MPTTTPTATVLLPEDVRTRLDSIREHAVSCGRLDCGHLGKSPYRAVRRAVILYTAEGMGLTLDLTNESAEVTATLGVLQSAGHARPVYQRRAGASVRYGAPVLPGVSLVMPNADGIKITRQRAEVYGYMLSGYSATEISSDPMRMRNGEPAPRVGLTSRAIETVKQHAGWLRRLTGAHDAVSALLALVIAGKLSDPAIVVPGSDDTDTDES